MVACRFRGFRGDPMSQVNDFVVLESVPVPRQPRWLGIMDGVLLRIGEESRLDGSHLSVPIIGLPGSEARVGLDAENVAFSPSRRFVAWSAGTTISVFDREERAVFTAGLPLEVEMAVHCEVEWLGDNLASPSIGRLPMAAHKIQWMEEGVICVCRTGPFGYRQQTFCLLQGFLYSTGNTQEELVDRSVPEVALRKLYNLLHAAHLKTPRAVSVHDGLVAATICDGRFVTLEGAQWTQRQIGANFGTCLLGNAEMPTPNSHIIHGLEWRSEGVLRLAVARVERNPNPAYDVSCVYANGTWYAELLELRL